MPNRILKESICTSREIDQLSPDQEVFFYRLLVNCDDYGRLEATPPLLWAKCYPLRLVKYSEKRVGVLLFALAEANLIHLYAIDSKRYLMISTWGKHQQIRAKRSKYPDPSNGNQWKSNEITMQSSDSNGNQLKSNVTVIQSNPIQSKSKYGEFENVLLTDEEYGKLKIRFKSALDDKIGALSEYMKTNPKRAQKYVDHYAVLLSWDRRDKKGNNSEDDELVLE